MYVDGYLLLVIYVLAVFAAATSVYALWSLEEIRLYYKRKYSQRPKEYPLPRPVVKQKQKGHWD